MNCACQIIASLLMAQKQPSALDGMLRAHAGSKVTLAVWSMEQGVPRPVTVALHALAR